MKRFAWLWGTLAGTALLLFVTMGGLYIVSSQFPHPRIPVSIPSVLHYTAFKFALAGAGLSFCTVILWTGTRRLGWRLLSALWGLFVLAYSLSTIWRNFTHSSFPSAKFYILMLDVTVLAPTTVWASALLFFALLLRARPLDSSTP